MSNGPGKAKRLALVYTTSAMVLFGSQVACWIAASYFESSTAFDALFRAYAPAAWMVRSSQLHLASPLHGFAAICGAVWVVMSCYALLGAAAITCFGRFTRTLGERRA